MDEKLLFVTEYQFEIADSHDFSGAKHVKYNGARRIMYMYCLVFNLQEHCTICGANTNFTCLD